MAVTITQTANPAGVAASSNVATYSSVSIGTASANRIIVVLVGTEATASEPSACTIDFGSGDTAMTAGTTGQGGIAYARTFYLAVPTGTTATIKVTYSSANPAMGANHIAVYSVTGATYSSAGSDSSLDMDATDPLTTGDISIATGGGFIAVVAGRNEAAKAWTNATADIDDDVGSFRFTTATRTTAMTSTAVICQGGSGEDGAMSWLIFTANESPTVALNSPSDSASITDTTPDLGFTGTDSETNHIRYHVQVSKTSYLTEFSDNFNFIDSSIWNNWGGANITINSGRLSLQSGTTQWAYHGITTQTTYDMTGKQAGVKVVSAGTQKSAYELYPIELELSSGNAVYWYINNGSASCYKAVSSTYTQVGSSRTHTDGDWYRIRESGGTTYWDYSTDGVTWTNQTSTANPIAVTAVSILIFVGVNANTTAETALIDNYNLPPQDVDVVSGTDSGFTGDPDNTDPYSSGQRVDYTVQSALDPATYYWRVRGIDPSGSNTYGAWSTVRSFEITSGSTASVSPVSLTLSTPEVTATYDEVDEASVTPVSLTITAPDITATYEEVVTASVEPISLTLSALAVTATHEAVYSADVSAIQITLTVPEVTATYSSELTANVDPVVLTLTIPETTATYVYEATASVEPIVLTLTIPAVTATYIEVDTASVDPVTLTATIPEVTATYEAGQIETASVDPVSLTLSAPAVTATYQEVDEASVSPVSLFLVVPEVTATYEQINSVSVDPIAITLSVPEVTATYEAVYSADVSSVQINLTIPEVTATFLSGWTVNVDPIAVTLTIPETTASYVYETTASVDPVVLTLTVPAVTAEYLESSQYTATVVPVVLTFSIPEVKPMHNGACVSPKFIWVDYKKLALRIDDTHYIRL